MHYHQILTNQTFIILSFFSTTTVFIIYKYENMKQKLKLFLVFFVDIFETLL